MIAISGSRHFRSIASGRKLTLLCQNLTTRTLEFTKTTTDFANEKNSNNIDVSQNVISNNPSSPTRGYKTRSRGAEKGETRRPGSVAFADVEIEAVADLFFKFAREGDSYEGGFDEHGSYLCYDGISHLLKSIGERCDEEMIASLFKDIDYKQSGKLHFDEFLNSADKVLGGNPAGIVLVIGGPGSGKGILSERLAKECGLVHLGSGELLRDEVNLGTPLGKEVQEIMARGELVSSAVITALVRRRMRAFPNRRVLLDGFPRSIENANDLVSLCGKPELALHLDCDDTILMERIIKRMREGEAAGNKRSDDNIDTALKRIRTFNQFHQPALEWLKENQIPTVNLDCSGPPDSVWNQLSAIGRLMRPAVAFSPDVKRAKKAHRNLFDEISNSESGNPSESRWSTG